MLAEIDRDGYQLESAEARHAEYGDEFWIPPRSERDSLLPGDEAKLLFLIRTAPGEYEAPEHVERMWVQVTGRDGELYVGRLDNEARYPGRTHLGMPVRFHAEHVADIARAEAEPSDPLGELANETLKRTSARTVDVIEVGRLASAANN